MLTLFTIPKAFSGEFNLIQRNAVRSWQRIRPHCEILLLGDESGTSEFADELGVSHIPDVDRNPSGTPLVPSLVSQAEKNSSNSLFCYVNADIVLFPDFAERVQRIVSRLPNALLTGQRTNLPVSEELDFSAGWEKSLKERADRDGILEACDGLDYFVFTRGFWGEIPLFAVGRTMWDQWFIYRARSRGFPVVDCSRQICIIHQNHSYMHHSGGKDGVWKGIEAQRNLELAGGYRNAYTLRDATHVAEKGRVRRKWLTFDLKRRFLVPLSTHKRLRNFICKTKSALEMSKP